jgi:predicted porin
MMKKSLIALAIAAAAPVAFAATSNVDVYGQARVSLSKATGTTLKVGNEDSRVGLKGSEDLGGGLTAIWGLEWGVNLSTSGATTVASTATATTVGTQIATSTGLATSTVTMGTIASSVSDNGITARNQFVGLKGAFGTVLAGYHDTPYKMGGSADVFADTAADAQKATTGIIGRNGFDTRAANAVAYISPDYAGFHVAVAGIAAEGTTNTWAATSVVAVYVNGPLKATIGQESYKDGGKATKYNAAYKIGDIGLGATYEKSSDSVTSTAGANDKGLLVSATYGMGPITLAAQYGKFDDNGTADVKRTTIGAVYSLSKRTNVALAYNSDNFEAAATTDVKTTTLQLNHSF